MVPVLTDDSSTVTIFADYGPLVNEIADEIRARGAATHTISVEAGWIDSVSHALLVLDSAAGMSAVRALCRMSGTSAHVVALITEDSAVDAVDAVDLCDWCSEGHDLVMLRESEIDVVERVTDEVVGTDRP